MLAICGGLIGLFASSEILPGHAGAGHSGCCKRYLDLETGKTKDNMGYTGDVYGGHCFDPVITCNHATQTFIAASESDGGPYVGHVTYGFNPKSFGSLTNTKLVQKKSA